jgi:6-phosphogluconolactonase
MQRKNDISVFNSVDDFEQETAEEIVRSMQGAIRDRGIGYIVLSGGETPKGVYRRFGTDPLRQLVDWSRVRIFFSDERCVAPDDPQSNFYVAERELLSRVNLVAENIHRMRVELGPEKAAADYEEVLRNFLDHDAPRFDVIMLGIGEDGHTASLFPSTEVLGDESRWARAVNVPRLNSWRVTLTFPAINAGREVFVLASGQSKASIIERALATKTPTKEIPITLVRPSQGSLRWMLDRQAAAGLNSLNHQLH